MTPPSWHEEPIVKTHDRKAFDCGDPAMNDFLQRYARQSHDLGGAKTFLTVDDTDNKTIVGFYSLVPAALAYADTPALVRCDLAQHEVLGFRLARLATDMALCCRSPPLLAGGFPGRRGRSHHRCEEPGGTPPMAPYH